MASLRALADAKTLEGLKTQKTFTCDPKDITIVEGFNVWDIDEERVAMFERMYKAGEAVPPLLVAVTDDQRIELVDGEHRLRGALNAHLEAIAVQEFKGPPESRLAAAMRYNNGRQMSPVQRARAYKRMLDAGWTKAKIAVEFCTSEGSVGNLILLAESGEDVMAMVDKDEIKATTVFTLARKVKPENVQTEIRKAAEKKETKAVKPEPKAKAKAKAAKKEKKTKKVLSSADVSFTKAEAMRVCELVCGLEWVGEVQPNRPLSGEDDDSSLTLRLSAKATKELFALRNKYMLSNPGGIHVEIEEDL